MTTNIEFKKGILFVRLNGSFYNETLNVFESRVITVILGICQICFGIKNVCGKKSFLIESIMSIAIQIVLISLGISFDIFGFGNVFLLIITIIIMIV